MRPSESLQKGTDSMAGPFLRIAIAGEVGVKSVQGSHVIRTGEIWVRQLSMTGPGPGSPRASGIPSLPR